MFNMTMNNTRHMEEYTTVNPAMVNMTMNSTTSTVLTMSDYDLLAAREWEELNSSNIVAVLFLSILLVLGIVGNIHAFFVYYIYYVPSNRRSFILWLAVVDLLNCVFVIPFSMLLAINKYTITSTFLCKVFYYFGTLFSGFSLVLLDIIAVDRLKRVVFPLRRQIKPQQVNIINSIFGVICLILALPLLINKKVKLKILPGGLVGSMCLNDVSTIGRRQFVKINGIMMTALFFIFVFFCIIMYIVIICVLNKYKHKMYGTSSEKSSRSGSISSRKTSWISLRLKRKGSVASAKSEDSEADIPERDKTNKQATNTKEEHDGNALNANADVSRARIFSNPDTNISALHSRDYVDSETTPMKPRPRPPLKHQDSKMSIRTQGSTRRIDRGKKTTMIFLVASLISCFGFLPNFAIIVYFIFFSPKSGVHGLGVLEPARRFLMAMSYINSTVNPLVYCFMDRKFRLECIRFYWRMKKKLT